MIQMTHSVIGCFVTLGCFVYVRDGCLCSNLEKRIKSLIILISAHREDRAHNEVAHLRAGDGYYISTYVASKLVCLSHGLEALAMLLLAWPPCADAEASSASFALACLCPNAVKTGFR